MRRFGAAVLAASAAAGVIAGTVAASTVAAGTGVAGPVAGGPVVGGTVAGGTVAAGRASGAVSAPSTRALPASMVSVTRPAPVTADIGPRPDCRRAETWLRRPLLRTGGACRPVVGGPEVRPER
jgi:hypothetical protein